MAADGDIGADLEVGPAELVLHLLIALLDPVPDPVDPRDLRQARGPDAHTPVDAARALAWHGPEDPGDWQPVTRAFPDGHTETWYAADATLGWWGPDGAQRLVAATADPATLPPKATWYLVTNLPRPGGPREPDSPHPAAPLAEIVRIYGIRHWVEQSYKQVNACALHCGSVPS